VVDDELPVKLGVPVEGGSLLTCGALPEVVPKFYDRRDILPVSPLAACHRYRNWESRSRDLSCCLRA
jgi:hypothetical protein